VLDPKKSGPLLFGNFILLTTLLNAPHFMASYRLLYDSRKHIIQYRSAAIYCPLLLIAYGVFALNAAASSPSSDIYINLLYLALGVYLAFHYTGQTWGMMASFSFIDGAAFNQYERKIFVNTLRYLCFWQIIWTLKQAQYFAGWLPRNYDEFYHLTSAGLFVAFFVGLYSFGLQYRRLHRLPPLRVLIPFCANFFWYALLYRYPNTLFWVQLSHALQYLIFPMRVELNRHAQQPSWKPRNPFLYLIIYFGALVATGYLTFYGIGDLLSWSNNGYGAYSAVITSLVNIHHFYIDGCVWKIRNPEVRKDLFAHIYR
jgi:hypothetical protein